MNYVIAFDLRTSSDLRFEWHVLSRRHQNKTVAPYLHPLGTYHAPPLCTTQPHGNRSCRRSFVHALESSIGRHGEGDRRAQLSSPTPVRGGGGAARRRRYARYRPKSALEAVSLAPPNRCLSLPPGKHGTRVQAHPCLGIRPSVTQLPASQGNLCWKPDMHGIYDTKSGGTRGSMHFHDT